MTKPKKIGIFGGTFNPVHNGHIRYAKLCLDKLKLDKLIVIPDNIPPHKSSQGIASSEDRINMLNLAFENENKIEVNDIEIKSTGKSFTIFTLEKLRKIYPDDKLYLIVGGDMFLCFNKWKEYEKILEMCTVCTAPRHPGELNLLLDFQQVIDSEKKCTVVLDVPVFEVCSSDIRDEVFSDKINQTYLPDKVRDYIEKKGLYCND